MINNHPEEATATPPVENPAMSFDQMLLDDMDVLLRASFAEKFAGFSRQLRIEDAAWTWHRTDNADGAVAVVSEPVEAAKLPPIRGSGYALGNYLDNLCVDMTGEDKDENNYLWCLQRMLPEAPPFRCQIVRVFKGGGQVLSVGNSDDPGVAMALAMLIIAGADFKALHRELYPVKYLARE